MEKLKEQVLKNIDERKEELKHSANDYVKKFSKEDDLLLHGEMIYMKEMIQDIERLLYINAKINMAAELEQLSDEEQEEYINEHIETHQTSAKIEFQKFIEERSFVD